MRMFTKVAVAAVLGSTLAVAAAASAVADPPSALTPARVDIVGVGSDTTQGVLNHIAASYNGQPATVQKLHSWDATGASPITTKQGCAAITRPNGSSAGIDALKADAAIPACIDFARSSRSKKTDGTEDGLAFVAMAKDGLTWAAQSTTNAPATLSAAQLADIYSCTATTWNQVGGASGNIIKPFLPQVGSGTRSFWLKAIGLTDAQVGPCVSQGIQENTGTALPNDPDAIAPYSIAVYIAQAYKGIDDLHGTTVLQQIGGTSSVLNPGPAAALNSGFPATFLRTVYNVIKKDPLGGVPAGDAGIFGPGGYICGNQNLVSDYGFGQLGAQCGAVS